MNDQSRTVAIVSYITIIGWIVALIMRQNEYPKSEFSRYHLRQSFGVQLILFASSMVRFVFAFLHLGFIGNFVWIIGAIIWLIGLINAIQGDFKGIPFIGDWFEENFDFIR